MQTAISAQTGSHPYRHINTGAAYGLSAELPGNPLQPSPDNVHVVKLDLTCGHYLTQICMPYTLVHGKLN